MNKFGYTQDEVRLFRRLDSPQKVQDYLNKIRFNFDERVGACLSPREVLKKKKADCVEGAIFAAAALEFHGRKPLLLDLRSVKKPYDYDHVVALFKEDGFWGSISKTNHAVLRYRDPVYRDVRELVMSYFNEYFLTDGKKTLREYSEPLNLNVFNPGTRAKLGTGQVKYNWRTTEKDLTAVLKKLDTIKHHKILSQKQIKNLRKVEKIEIEASWEEEYGKN